VTCTTAIFRSIVRAANSATESHVKAVKNARVEWEGVPCMDAWCIDYLNKATDDRQTNGMWWVLTTICWFLWVFLDISDVQIAHIACRSVFT
jgi:hypothetical protein